MASSAEMQHGVISHRQLCALGFSPAAIGRLVRSGCLHPIHRAVYAVGHPKLSQNGCLMAAVLSGGERAAISHRSAAAMHGLLEDRRAVVDVVSQTNRRARRGIRFHESRLGAEELTAVDGIPVTSLARTLLDVAEVVPRRRLVYALEQAEKLGTFDLRAIETCIARNHGRRGIKPLRQAMRATEPEALYAHEGLERLFIAFCRRHEIQRPALNAVVEGLTVDALWAKQKVIVELDSWTHHRTRRSFEEDRRRDAVLKLAGYEVLRVTDRWLAEEPVQVARILAGLLARG